MASLIASQTILKSIGYINVAIYTQKFLMKSFWYSSS
jgi:hypothetical protein